MFFSDFSALIASFLFFFFNDTATTEIYTLSLHDALPISNGATLTGCALFFWGRLAHWRSEEHTSELQSRRDLVCRLLLEKKKNKIRARLSQNKTRNSKRKTRTHTRDNRAMASPRRRMFQITVPCNCPAARPFFFSRIPQPTRPTLFPYTTLFR